VVRSPRVLDFRILGPLEVRDGETALHLGGAKQRAVLALLLLHANEVVSTGRLIDELWGASPPDDATTALQAHVSRLRKALPGGAEVLVTRQPGYLVRVEPAQVDLQRFESRVSDGRAALADGDAASASRLLREALELWRGRPLADLEDEPFARDAIADLEEGWLDAVGSRIDADLALGRQTELIQELRALVREHPLREGFRAQLMLALYRTGRQTEALDVFADTSRTLDADLGLAPGPELQRLQQSVLNHDPALELPSVAAASRRRPFGVAIAVAVLLAAAVVAAIVVHSKRHGASPVAIAPGTGSVVTLDATNGDVLGRVAAGRTPSAIAVRNGVAWLVDADAQTVLRVSDRVETFSTGSTPTDVAVGQGSVWVAGGRPLARAQFVGPVATGVARIDETTGTSRGVTPLPLRGGSLSNLVENHVAARGNAAWAVTADYSVVRIERATGVITARSAAIPAAAVAAGPAGVWALGIEGTVARLDERTGRPIARVHVPTESVGSIAVGRDAAWVTSPDGLVWRIGASPHPTVGAIELDRGVDDVVAGATAVWVANPLAGTVVEIAARSSRVERTVELGGIPRSLALDGGKLWVALVGDPVASTTRTAGVRPFPPSACERMVTGRGDADVLLVSDLALQGGTRISTTQMAQAITFVLREHGFRAGRFRVAYQSCDDSLASTGLYDEPKCAANARAYSGNPDVVGVIGTFNSPCAVAALPELNRARGGPLAMVSPLNSFVGLTRAGVGVDPALPAALYPTGRRNYLRVFPTDDLQGAALALFAQARGTHRVFVLDDGAPGYGQLLAAGFQSAARRLGLTVVGHAGWDPQASDYAKLAAYVARARPDAVFLGGLLDTNAAGVVGALRQRFGGSVDLLAPDGLTPLPLLVQQTTGSALGMYVSLAGVVTQRLPPAGARFVRRFKRTQQGVEVQPSAVYAAQAAEVMLDAIAHSDGTRDSVLAQLFREKVRNGLLGSFGFDANGDTTEAPITILQVVGGGGSNTVASAEGGMVERVLRPSVRLVEPAG
jgi:DNA-binding SARP family transcriptional activator/ABC-type branched-subunit amino acid transport system substrate-binding protein